MGQGELPLPVKTPPPETQPQNEPPALPPSGHFATLPRTEVADILGWLSNPSTLNRCEGYYLDPPLDYPNQGGPSVTNNLVHITANNTELAQEGRSMLSGNVIISQPMRQLESDTTYLNRDPQTHQITTADLYGHIHMREPGRLIIGEKAHVNLVDNSGTLYDSLYRMTLIPLTKSLNKSVPGRNITLNSPIEIEGLTAWGTARKITREPSGIVKIFKGTYTTCPPLQHTWMVKTNTLTLDKEEGRGTATGAQFYFHDTPLMYVPYFNFPLDNRRKTGFLFPSAGHSTETGYELALPFYWNIAPNYDATITPNLMELRGVQLNGEFRYLTPSSNGNIHGSILPDDRQFSEFKEQQAKEYPPNFPGLKELEDDSNTRSFVSLFDSRRYNAHWSSYLYANHASDDYYFTDFDSDPAQVTSNQIVNEAYVAYASEHWNFMTRLLGYQTLHPLDQIPVQNQYRKLPEIILNGHYPEAPYNMDLQLNNSFVYFNKTESPADEDNIFLVPPVEGSRVNINPVLTLPNYWLAGFFTPQLQLEATQYDLTHNTKCNDPQAIQYDLTHTVQCRQLEAEQFALTHQGNSQKNDITRVLPLFDIDMGLLFDRDLKIANTNYQQTLEPRLFYLYVPYVDQSNIPLFDTGIQPFTFSQLFRTNRFSGIDRIGDANQISVALTSRLLTKDTGEEKIRASIGQIIYFENRRVNLTEDTPNIDLVSRAIRLPPDVPTSPIVGEINYHLTPQWLVNTSLAWDPNFNRTNNASFGFQYKLDNQRIVNLGYNYLRGGDTLVVKTFRHGDLSYLNAPTSSHNDLSQTDLSFVWPLNEKWSGIGRWNYNVSHAYTQNVFAGVQYDSCCWAIRLVGGRELNYVRLKPNDHTKPIFDNKIYLEFALKGLGNLATKSAESLLGKSIVGYTDNFGGFY